MPRPFHVNCFKYPKVYFFIAVICAVLICSLPSVSVAKGKSDNPRANQINLRMPDGSTEDFFLAKPTAGNLELWATRKSTPASKRSFALQDYSDKRRSLISEAGLIPLTIAQGDFTMDGIHDLITGFQMGDKGMITMRPGLAEAIFPTKSDWMIHPIIPFGDERTFSVPVPPNRIVSGDFNNDGLLDLVISDNHTKGVFLIPGHNETVFGEPILIPLQGRATSLLSADLGRIDHLSNLIVATENDGKAIVLIYQNPKGAVLQPPDQLQVEEPIVAMDAGRVNDDSYVDLILATSHQFVSCNGTFSGVQTQSKTFTENAARFQELRFSLQNDSSVVRAELNGEVPKELVAFDGARSQLRIVTESKNGMLTEPDFFATDTPPIAVLPMRLNPTAIDVLVVLKADGTLSYMTPPPGAIIAVDTTADDTTTGGTSNGVISLREAILLSSGGTGGDGITTGLGRSLTTGSCPGALKHAISPDLSDSALAILSYSMIQRLVWPVV